MAKKVEEIRIPSVRYPSIYHDPAKLNALPPEVVQLKFNNSKACVQNTVRVGLIQLAVNTSLSHMSVQVVCKYIESNFRLRILGKYASDEVFGDFARKQRIPVSPHFLIESFNGINFSLFNGHADGH
uniref:Uncharacterized protein n=1 Tax=Ditylenchus dipsaci TaxID=166011 RepID=A0A915D167_9BILA